MQCVFCGFRSAKNCGRTFHRFPVKDVHLLEQWLINMDLFDYKPTVHSVLCSSHFSEDCFERSSFSVLLKCNSVPNKFDSPGNHCVCCKRKRSPSTRQSFFKFPLDNLALLEEWLKNIGKNKEWKPSTTTLICSRHFTDFCFRKRKEKYLSLKKGSCPTLFGENENESSIRVPIATVKRQKTCTETARTKGIGETEGQEERADINDYSEDLPESTFHSPPNSPRMNRRMIDHDHAYVTSPSTLRRKYALSQQQLKEKKSLLELKERKIMRITRKTASLKEIIYHLRSHQLVSETCVNALESIDDKGIKELWQRAMENRECGMSRKQYPPSLRSFALTLHFYSPKAYEYVREKLNYALPSARTIRAWYNTLEGNAGFTAESFEALKIKVNIAAEKGEVVKCSLVLDEMGIKKGTQIGRDMKVYGHVDFGAELEANDETSEAKNALVFMVVSVDKHWKLPIGYFLIDGITSDSNASLIKNALTQLHEVGVLILSVIFDGTAEHHSTAKLLGANFSLDNLKPLFSHPVSGENVQIIFDACHMLKLIRNALGTWKALVDGEGSLIEWRFIEALAVLQENEGLRLGNKLRRRHVQWTKMKMNVPLAAQTLSSSVADSIDYCREVLQMPQFQGSEGTVKFIRAIDVMFDFLNSRNYFGKGFKAPLSKQNEHVWRPRINNLLDYLSRLQSYERISIFKTKRRTGFLGLFSACHAVMNLYDEHVKPETSGMKYLLTYKLSQDHLELLFCAIRGCGGWCPNPTCLQFISAYKKLLLRHEVKSCNGNVEMMDQTRILTVPSTKAAKLKSFGVEVYNEMANARVARKYSLNLETDLDSNIEFPRALFVEISNFSAGAVAYICGFIVRKVCSRIPCEICRQALVLQDKSVLHEEGNTCSDSDASYRKALQLISIKSNGGLLFPSQSSFDIALTTEKLFRHSINCNNGNIPIEPLFPTILQSRILMELIFNPAIKILLFPDLDDHIFDDSVEELSGHVFTLTKTFVDEYIRLRMFALTKSISLKQVGENLRHFTNRTLIWKNQ